MFGKAVASTEICEKSLDLSTEGFGNTKEGTHQNSHAVLLPIAQPNKKGQMQSILRHNLKVNQERSYIRTSIQQSSGGPGTLRRKDSGLKDGEFNS